MEYIFSSTKQTMKNKVLMFNDENRLIVFYALISSIQKLVVFISMSILFLPLLDLISLEFAIICDFQLKFDNKLIGLVFIETT